MGIVTEKRRVCDLCQRDDGIRQFRVTFLDDGQRGRSIAVDLCEEHGKPFEEIRKRLPEGKRGRPRGQAVVSPKDVEAARTRKKPASTTKRATPRKKSS